MLRRLQPEVHPDLLVGVDTLDDAGVFRLRPDLALVQTLDFFPPLVDDPYDFGRIAAANALSDVYAMGGEPLTAMNIVAFPDQELDPEILVEILRGGADAVHEAGAILVGGHSIRDTEIKYGLSVTGRVHPDQVLSNAGAKPGDVLVLTKPIGSGILTTAAKRDRLSQDDLSEAIHVMSSLNRPGAAAAKAIGIHACTDITGFGLVGHAGSMAAASGAAILLLADCVPLMDMTLDMAREGVLTRAARQTQEHLGNALQIDDGIEPVLASVLMDAQTSGGLLLAVPPERCDALRQSLRAEGAICNAVIGMVTEASGFRVRMTRLDATRDPPGS